MVLSFLQGGDHSHSSWRYPDECAVPALLGSCDGPAFTFTFTITPAITLPCAIATSIAHSHSGESYLLLDTL